MDKNTTHTTSTDEQTISELEILWAIRYLDPDMDPETSDVVVFVVLVAIVSVAFVVCFLLRLRGL